jgi:hypothetical protein
VILFAQGWETQTTPYGHARTSGEGGTGKEQTDQGAGQGADDSSFQDVEGVALAGPLYGADGAHQQEATDHGGRDGAAGPGQDDNTVPDPLLAVPFRHITGLGRALGRPVGPHPEQGHAEHAAAVLEKPVDGQVARSDRVAEAGPQVDDDAARVGEGVPGDVAEGTDHDRGAESGEVRRRNEPHRARGTGGVPLTEAA